MWLKVLLLVPLDLVLPTNRREQETVPASWRLALAESRMNEAGGGCGYINGQLPRESRLGDGLASGGDKRIQFKPPNDVIAY